MVKMLRLPLGILAPSSMYCCGFFKKLTNSIISILASSQPATSLKATLISLALTSFAVVLATLPMPNIPPPPPGLPPRPPKFSKCVKGPNFVQKLQIFEKLEKWSISYFCVKIDEFLEIHLNFRA